MIEKVNQGRLCKTPPTAALIRVAVGGVFLLAYLLLAYDGRNGAIGADRSAAVSVDFDAVIASAHGKYACLFHPVWKCVTGLVMIDDVLYLFLVVNMATSV